MDIIFKLTSYSNSLILQLELLELFVSSHKLMFMIGFFIFIAGFVWYVNSRVDE